MFFIFNFRLTPRQEAGGWRQEARGGRQEAGGGRQEAGGGRQAKLRFAVMNGNIVSV